MQIDLLRLKSGIEKSIIIHEEVVIDQSLLEKTDIIELSPVQVDGEIKKGTLDAYTLSITIHGTMVLPCSVSLEPVDYPFEIELEEDLLTLVQEIDENIRKIENTIDLLSIIWENILMEIPIKVISEKASTVKKEGEGWKIITEDEDKTIINPEFEKLKDLLQ